MYLPASFYADRFRQLADQFSGAKAATGKGAALGENDLLDMAGRLFLAAADHGHLHSLVGARALIESYREAEEHYGAGEIVGFVKGMCVKFAERPQALRAPCPVNLFLDVAGDSSIEVYNDGGVVKPIRQLPPDGLLPAAHPNLFHGGRQLIMLINAQNEAEADDFSRNAQSATTDRYSLACRVLAYLLDAESNAAASDGRAQRPGAAPSGRNSSPGAAVAKIIGALIRHHKYDSQSCLNFDPIGNNDLARTAGVSPGSVSKFWKDKFRADGTHGSYDAYCRSCSNGRLPLILALLNGDMPPTDVLQGIREDVRREMNDE